MQYSTQLLREARRSIGRALHLRRCERRMTLRELSQKSGIPEWRIDAYEIGKGDVHFNDLIRLSCALGAGLMVSISHHNEEQDRGHFSRPQTR